MQKVKCVHMCINILLSLGIEGQGGGVKYRIKHCQIAEEEEEQ